MKSLLLERSGHESGQGLCAETRGQDVSMKELFDDTGQKVPPDLLLVVWTGSNNFLLVKLVKKVS